MFGDMTGDGWWFHAVSRGVCRAPVLPYCVHVPLIIRCELMPTGALGLSALQSEWRAWSRFSMATGVGRGDLG